jgi:hypothetical protein
MARVNGSYSGFPILREGNRNSPVSQVGVKGRRLAAWEPRFQSVLEGSGGPTEKGHIQVREQVQYWTEGGPV